jgi:hypothetical protein
VVRQDRLGRGCPSTRARGRSRKGFWPAYSLRNSSGSSASWSRANCSSDKGGRSAMRRLSSVKTRSSCSSTQCLWLMRIAEALQASEPLADGPGGHAQPVGESVLVVVAACGVVSQGDQEHKRGQVARAESAVVEEDDRDVDHVGVAWHGRVAPPPRVRRGRRRFLGRALYYARPCRDRHKSISGSGEPRIERAAQPLQPLQINELIHNSDYRTWHRCSLARTPASSRAASATRT